MGHQRTERIFVETERHRITGDVTLSRDGYRSRVSDLLNAGEREFITLTDADIELIGHESETPTRHDHVIVSRAHIVIAIAEDGAERPVSVA